DERPKDPNSRTGAYADLLFAFVLARLGETTECEKLSRRAQDALRERDTVHSWLRQADDFRLREAVEGKAQAAQLPEELLRGLEAMSQMDRYRIDRRRTHCRILELHEKIDPYRHWTGRYADDLGRELALLADVRDRGELAARLKGLLQEVGP